MVGAFSTFYQNLPYLGVTEGEASLQLQVCWDVDTIHLWGVWPGTEMAGAPGPAMSGFKEPICSVCMTWKHVGLSVLKHLFLMVNCKVNITFTMLDVVGSKETGS